MTRPLPVLSALLALFGLALLAPGCDDPEPLQPGEKLIAVGAIPVDPGEDPDDFGTTRSLVCPDSSNDYLASVRVVATVFGADGAVANGTDVLFETTHGEYDESVVATNEAGQAFPLLTLGRVPGGSDVVVQGTIEDDAISDDHAFSSPVLPSAAFAALSGVDIDGNVFLSSDPETDVFFEIALLVGQPCDLAEVAFELEYNPAKVEPVVVTDQEDPRLGEVLIAESGVFNLATGDETIPTDWSVTDTGHSIRLDYYRRTDDPQTGYSSAGAPSVIALSFKALEPGPAELEATSLRLTPSAGNPGGDYQISIDDVSVVEIDIVAPPSE